MAAPMAMDNSGLPGSDAQPNKRRRKKSIVWEHFTIETVDSGCTRACCNQCKKSFAYITGSKLAGTSHLKRHIALGICPVGRRNQENQLIPHTHASIIDSSASGDNPTRKRYGTPSRSVNTTFSQANCNNEIAKMIILHDYPLQIVEHPGFINFARILQPQFNSVSINSIQESCVGIYRKERENLLNFLGAIQGRVNLTLDLWTSDQSLGYVILTGHFIDNDWKLHRRILNVILLPFPDSEAAFDNAVAACLADWNLDSKLLTLILDQSFANENVRCNLRCLLPIKNAGILNSQLIIGNCYSRVLSRLAQHALASMMGLVSKVRQSVKYVITSEAHEEKFIELKHHLQVPSTKNLIIDDETKWDTTYHMLVAAAELKEVFSCLDTSDPDYKLTPSMDEWKQIDILCTYLELFFDAANILTSPTYLTANVFFPKVLKIQVDLTTAASSTDPFISNLTKPLQQQFSTYWKDCSLLLASAAVLDPRLKMKVLEFSFPRIYGEEAEAWIKIVYDGVHELYLDYVVQSLPPPTFIEEDESIGKLEISQDETLVSVMDGLSDFEVYLAEYANQQMKSELDQYLEESILPRVQDLDVLGWWKLNKLKYPTLSKMASDILSIPVSTVPPDSVFDTRRKRMHSCRSSLSPPTIEALVCAKDWLQYGASDFSLKSDNLIVRSEH